MQLRHLHVRRVRWARVGFALQLCIPIQWARTHPGCLHVLHVRWVCVGFLLRRLHLKDIH